MKISFGEMFAKRSSNEPVNPDVVSAVDASVEQDYRENL